MLDFLMSACPRPQHSRSQDPVLVVLPMRQTRPDVPAESIFGSGSQKLGDLMTIFHVILIISCPVLNYVKRYDVMMVAVWTILYSACLAVLELNLPTKLYDTTILDTKVR